MIALPFLWGFLSGREQAGPKGPAWSEPGPGRGTAPALRRDGASRTARRARGPAPGGPASVAAVPRADQGVPPTLAVPCHRAGPAPPAPR